MRKSDILERNLLALSSRNPELSRRLTGAEPDTSISFIQSRSNHIVPVYTGEDRTLALHSRFDPVKEGQRYLQSIGDAGFIIFLGLGAGYQVRPALESGKSMGILIIEKNIRAVRSVLERVDMSGILMNPKVKILIDANLYDVGQAVLNNYLPTISGDLKTISLPSRVNVEREYFRNVVRIVRSSIEQIADDYTVQSSFGIKWFVNTLSNMNVASRSTQTLSPIRKAVITGAGPSLEDQTEKLRQIRQEVFLIASDTSLPYLLAQDIVPDLVISIDCQHISYHHFLRGYPKEVPLVLDLASPPLLTRLTDKLFFFSSGHPFSQYINRHWRKFPDIDTSGGNVSHAALSLAQRLGAEEIYLLGIDFSFPEGKTYAKETYLYPFFRMTENRVNPLENCLFSFLFRNRDLVTERVGNSIRYTTKPMLSYKERMEIAIRDMEPRIKAEKGRGLNLVMRQKDSGPEEQKQALTKKEAKTRVLLSQGAASSEWRQFLSTYREDIAALKRPEKPLSRYWGELSAKERELWFTLLPSATALKETRRGAELDSVELLGEVRSWSVSILDRYLV